MSINPLTIRLIMLGNGGVGKSAITLRFMYDEFVDTYEPTRLDAYKKDFTLEDKLIDVRISDTAGQESYNAVSDAYYRGGDGFMLVFSVEDMESFKALDQVYNDIRVAKQLNKAEEYPVIVLVGNKSDLPNPAVTHEAVMAKAIEWQSPYFETSARSNININEAYTTLITNTVRAKYVPIQQPVESVENSSSRCCQLL